MNKTMKATLAVLALGASAMAANADLIVDGNTPSFSPLAQTLANQRIPSTANGFRIGQEAGVLPGGMSYNPLITALGNHTASRTLSVVVPEPTTLLAGALLVVPFAINAVRIVRRNKTA